MVADYIKFLFQHYHQDTWRCKDKSQYSIITLRAKQGSYTGPPKYYAVLTLKSKKKVFTYENVNNSIYRTYYLWGVKPRDCEQLKEKKGKFRVSRGRFEHDFKKMKQSKNIEWKKSSLSLEESLKSPLYELHSSCLY